MGVETTAIKRANKDMKIGIGHVIYKITLFSSIIDVRCLVFNVNNNFARIAVKVLLRY